MLHKISVTRLGDLLHFGQIFKASGNNYFAQTAHILGKFCRGIKIFHFSSGIIFGQLLLTFGDFLLVTLPPTYLSMYFHQYVPSSYQCDQIGRFLEFGQLFEALATINLSQSPHSQANFVKVSKSLIFLLKSFLGNFY